MSSTLHSAHDLGAAIRALRPDALAAGIEIGDDWCREQLHDLGITRYEDVEDETLGAIADRVDDLAAKTDPRYVASAIPILDRAGDALACDYCDEIDAAERMYYIGPDHVCCEECRSTAEDDELPARGTDVDPRR